MIDLSTQYLGLNLKNPIIVGSSGLTQNIDNLKEIEKMGGGAVVLKSLFEEQIKMEIQQVFSHDDASNYYTEADDYIRNYSRSQAIDNYLNLIREAKNSIKIPVMASINCISATEWTSFASEIEAAGADALELNIFVIPAEADKKGEEYEKIYFDIVQKVTSKIKIPVALKISYHFSGLAEIIKRLSWTNAKGLVLFNRFFSPDVDIDSISVKSGGLYSDPADISMSLRWIAIMEDKVQADLCASTGVHDATGMIKQLLVGAKAVQISSILYKNGFSHLQTMIKELEGWMKKHNFSSISEFRGKLSHKKSVNSEAFQRVQFMKHFAGIE